MASKDLRWLIFLAAIWGSSFLFMRLASPVLGPAYLVEGRSFFAAFFLLLLALHRGRKMPSLKDWRHYVFMGFFNSAFPFILFAQASLHLTTSQLTTLNSTGPIWGYLIGLLTKDERFSLQRGLGLVLGFMGVCILFGQQDLHVQADVLTSIAAGLAAACCYGIASNYARHAKSIDPFDNAHGSMWGSALILLPTLFYFPTLGPSTPLVWASVLALGVLCSGIAYLIYFRLIEDVGAASALSVGFLIPLFGTLWGWIFLDEALTLNVLLGMVIILVGTALVVRFDWKSLFLVKAS